MFNRLQSNLIVIVIDPKPGSQISGFDSDSMRLEPFFRVGTILSGLEGITSWENNNEKLP